LTFYNRVILIGYLTKPPDTRYSPSGHQVGNLTLQISDEMQPEGSRYPQIIDVIALEKRSSQGSRFLEKGCRVLVEGRIRIRRWKTVEGQEKTKVEIIAERVLPLRNENRLNSEAPGIGGE
jgi:single-strand DNA-binding protein